MISAPTPEEQLAEVIELERFLQNVKAELEEFIERKKKEEQDAQFDDGIEGPVQI